MHVCSAHRFDRRLIHLDVNVLDHLDMPLAENTRRNLGLRFAALRAEALRTLWMALTVCEVEPRPRRSRGLHLALVHR